MKPGLSGYTIARNCLSLDYCVDLAIKSLLPICDEVLVADSDSSDGTREWLDDWARREPKLRVINFGWKNPVGQVTWLTDWMNFAREHLEYDRQIYLDADEILGERAQRFFKNTHNFPLPLWFDRLTFWKDPYHLVPEGHCCGSKVVRYGPTKLWMPSDEIHEPGQHPGPEPEIRLRGTKKYLDVLKIFHYGFLRKPQALIDKCKVVLPALLGTYDERLVEAEKHPERRWEEFAPFPVPLQEWNGEHPQIAHDWIRERGYSLRS